MLNRYYYQETEELRERLAESERLVELMNKSWDERLKDTEDVYRVTIIFHLLKYSKIT